MPVILVYGDEPYMVEREKAAVTSGGGMTRLQEFTPDTLHLLRSPSLFGPARVLSEIDTLKKLDNDVFFGYVEDPADDATLLIIVRKVDERLKVFSRIKKNENILIKKCDKVSEKTFVSFLQGIFKRRERAIEDVAFRLLVERLNYQDADVNMYTCGNAVTNLLDATDDAITVADIDRFFPEEEVFNRFKIAPLLEKKDMDSLYKAAVTLTKDPGAIPFLMLLQRELRVAYKSRHFKLAEIGAKGASFRSMSEETLVSAMGIVSNTVVALKLSDIPEEIAVAHCFRQIVNLTD